MCLFLAEPPAPPPPPPPPQLSAKDLLGPKETIIDPHYMVQLLMYGIRLGQNGTYRIDTEEGRAELIPEGEVSVFQNCFGSLEHDVLVASGGRTQSSPPVDCTVKTTHCGHLHSFLCINPISPSCIPNNVEIAHIATLSMCSSHAVQTSVVSISVPQKLSVNTAIYDLLSSFLFASWIIK